MTKSLKPGTRPKRRASEVTSTTILNPTCNGQPPRYSRDRYEVVIVDEALGDPRTTTVTNATLAECEEAVSHWYRLHPDKHPIYQPIVVPMEIEDGQTKSQFEGCELLD
jgi:hypothetical protein